MKDLFLTTLHVLTLAKIIFQVITCCNKLFERHHNEMFESQIKLDVPSSYSIMLRNPKYSWTYTNLFLEIQTFNLRKKKIGINVKEFTYIMENEDIWHMTAKRKINPLIWKTKVPNHCWDHAVGYFNIQKWSYNPILSSTLKYFFILSIKIDYNFFIISTYVLLNSSATACRN